MLIGEVSRRSGVTTRMLRHYDSLGLVRPTGRTSGGYRDYSDADIQRIFHVESLRSLGLSLSEVQRALDDRRFQPRALVGNLIREAVHRLEREEELLARLRRVEASEPHDWADVLRIVMLLRALDSKHTSLRHRAALSAGSTEPVSPELLADALLAESDPNLAGALRWALARAGTSALAGVASGLASPKTDVRRRAVAAVVDIPGDEAAALLRDALADRDNVIRHQAAVELGARGMVEAVPTLLEMVVAGHKDVDAADALGHLAQDADAAHEVVVALVDSAENADTDVRLRLVQALAEIPGESALEALSQFTCDADHVVSHTARSIIDAR